MPVYHRNAHNRTINGKTVSVKESKPIRKRGRKRRPNTLASQAARQRGSLLVALADSQWHKRGATAAAGRDGIALEEASWQEIGSEWREEAGFTSVEEARHLKTAGFDADEAREWRKRTEFGPFEARDWWSEGFQMMEAEDWAQEGFGLHKATQWVRAGFDPSEAEEAATWRGAGFEPETAAALSHGGYAPQEASDYLAELQSSLALTDVEATDWHGAGRGTGEIQAWQEASFGPQEAQAWNNAGFSADEAAAWREGGFGPVQAAELLREGYRAEEARVLVPAVRAK